MENIEDRLDDLIDKVNHRLNNIDRRINIIEGTLVGIYRRSIESTNRKETTDENNVY